MSSLKDQIKVIDDTYLMGVANKGLVNRAKKGLESAEVTFTLTDSALEATFNDGISVKISGTLTNFECSCPSRTICKHVLMAFISAAQNNENKQDEAVEPPDFTYLLSYTQDTLVKEFGKKIYNNILYKLMGGETSDIDEASILNVTIQGGITVRFLPSSNMSDSICTCKAKKCHHRLEAILQYIRFKTGELPFELIAADSVVNTEIIPHVLTFIEDIYRIGLFRLPPEYSEKCTQFSTLCHGAGFVILERLFEACAEELFLHEQKNFSFNINKLMRNLALIHQTCYAIQNGKDAAALAGNFRRQYMELPEINIFGLGAYPWYASSGFCGVTAVFYCPVMKKTFTFSSSLPTESENEGLASIKKFWQMKSAWNLHISLDQLAKAELKLRSAKSSDNGRLSSSDSVIGTLVQAQTNIEELQDFVLEDFTRIKALFGSDLDSQRMIYAVIKPHGMDEGGFNHITQEYRIRLNDHLGNGLHLTIPYSQTTETTLLNFEHLAKRKTKLDAITVSITISEDKYETSIFPIAYWKSGELKNFGKDRLVKDKKSSDFARFFNMSEVVK